MWGWSSNDNDKVEIYGGREREPDNVIDASLLSANPTRFASSHFYSSELSQYKSLSTPLNLLGVRHISSQILTNQEPGQIVQRNFS